MTTVEKLLVQFYERKHSIVELVKQRTELYNQHLASNFLIDGITPPAWLWDPNSSGSKELNKDDVISKLLHPYPQPSACCSVSHYPGYNNLVITGYNEEFSDGDFVENPAFSKDLERKNNLTAPGFSGLNLGECVPNQVPQLDAIVASPDNQTDDRILNIYTASDKSLAGIQRSKSRQKALELRSSAKALATSGLRHESISDVVSSQIRFSLSITNQPGQNDELSQLAEPCSQSCEDRNVVEGHCLSRETGVDTYSERITRSGSYAEVPISVKGSFPLGFSSENYIEKASSQDAKARRKESMPISDSEHADNHVKQSPKSAGPSAVYCQSFKDEETNVHTGEITRSGISSKRRSCGCDSTIADSSSDDYQGIDITTIDCGDALPPDCVDGSLVKVNLSNIRNEGCDAQESVLEDFGRHKERDTFPSSSSIQHNACVDEISDLEVSSVSAKVHGSILALSSARSARQVNDSEELSGLVKPSDGLFRRLTRSQTRSYDKETYHPVTDNENPSVEGTKSISDCEEKSAEELQPTSSGQSVPHCLGTHNMLHDDKNGKLVMASELVLLDHVDLSCLSSSNYSKQGRGLESEVALIPSEYFSPVEPKQLEFKETEEYNFKAFTSRSGHRSLDNLPQKMSCFLHVPDASLVKGISGGNNLPSSSKQLLGMSDVSSEEDKAHRDSFEPDVQESPDSHAENSGPIIFSAIVNALKDSTKAELNCRSSEVQDKGANLLSEAERRGLESEVALNPSDYFVSVEPKQLEFKETGEYNLKAFTSRSGNRSLDNMPQKMSCSLHVPDVLVKGICSGNNQPSSSKQLLGMPDVSSEEDKAHRDSFKPDIHESPDTHAENFGPAIGSAILNAFDDSTEGELNCRSSEVQDEAGNLLSEIVDVTDIQIPRVKLHLEHGLESSPVHCLEQGDCSDEGRYQGQLVSSGPESKNSRFSYGHSSAEDPVAESYDCLIKKAGINPFAINEIKQFSARQSRLLSWPEGEVCSGHGDSSVGNNSLGKPSTVRLHGKNSLLERSFTHGRVESWPQAKRRKIELQQAHSFTTSQSFRVTKPRSFQRDPANMYPKTMEIDVDTGLMEHLKKSMDDGICSEVNTDRMDEIQNAILSQHGEVGSCYIEKNEHKNTSPVINNEQLVATISSLAMKESRNSGRCFIEETRTPPSRCDYLDARTSGDKQCSKHLCILENYTDSLNFDNLDLSSTLHKEIQQFPKWEDGLHTQHSILSSSKEDLQLTDVDSSMPVFEGFTVNAQTDTGELDFAADGFDLGELELPRTALERASILAEICRSASLDRPSPHFSSAFKFQETWNLCKSVPDDGHLEHMECGNIYPLNPDVGTYFQSRSSSSDDDKDALDGMPYSVSRAYSGERYGWNSRNQPSSPVGKLWDQLSSRTGSSGKCSNSNPELTCFPIEEDPNISEDNKTMEENAGDTQDETDSSLVNRSNKRQPLKDLTNMGKNPLMSVSAEEETLRADSVDFLSSKCSVTGTQEKALLRPEYQCRKNSETSEMQTSSTGTADGRKHQFSFIGPNAIRKAKQSVNNSTRKSMKNKISKPFVSNKTSLKGQDQKLSLIEPRRNNIVLNVSSFIPLIQQKQAATECTGKKDVKVKALEAAEAAKRLEERKENERKMRKEALKLERAKLEEKNLRNMELEKKKKDEERKKKDADIIAKKRLREEEERKEKEKKRMRLEVRQRHREQEEKKRAERPEKENQRTKDNQMNSKKEFNNESKRQQNRGTAKGEGVALQKTDTNSLNEVVVNYEECGTSGLTCEAGEAIHAVDKSPRKEDLLVQNSKKKSYEISPYQDTDDEEEEDEELPIKKYIPSWASKSSVALFLPLQQELDPDVIFTPDKFCSMDEVLLPRKLQQKQVAP